jgi:hypothetical protein
MNPHAISKGSREAKIDTEKAEMVTGDVGLG